MEWKGNPVSEGCVIGQIYIYAPMEYDPQEEHIAPGGEAQAIDRWRRGREKAGRELDELIARFQAAGDDKAKIFAAHREILFDQELELMVEQSIREEGFAPSYGAKRAFEDTAQLLSQVDDPLIAERAADLKDVCRRLLRVMEGKEERSLSALPGPVIVAAHDLLPSDTATLDRNNVLGILTEVGGGTSHTAIIAKSYKIPAVLGIPGALQNLKDGETVILDALEGKVITQPDEPQLQHYREKRERFARSLSQIELCRDKPALTRDGTAVEIGMNIGSCEDSPDYGVCDYVGLFRTEFLYMQSDHLPTEEEQFAAYRKVLENARGKVVTLRTLDIGGDKSLPYLELPKEENPFLGQRALRLCFAHRELFLTQLRAALRASVYGQLWLMLPMVGSIDDIRRAKKLFEEAKESLRQEDLPFDPEVKLGIMIEIPSIALLSDLAAREVDFASIGTNDLCQYLCAADRMNPQVAECYQSLSPAMLRLLRTVVEAFDRAGKPISVCGEMAGEPQSALALVGLGFRKLSMSPGSFARIKYHLSGVPLSELEQKTRQALDCLTQEEAKALLPGAPAEM